MKFPLNLKIFLFHRYFHEGRDCNENRAYGIQSSSEYPPHVTMKNTSEKLEQPGSAEDSRTLKIDRNLEGRHICAADFSLLAEDTWLTADFGTRKPIWWFMCLPPTKNYIKRTTRRPPYINTCNDVAYKFLLIIILKVCLEGGKWKWEGKRKRTRLCSLRKRRRVIEREGKCSVPAIIASCYFNYKERCSVWRGSTGGIVSTPHVERQT